MALFARPTERPIDRRAALRGIPERRPGVRLTTDERGQTVVHVPIPRGLTLFDRFRPPVIEKKHIQATHVDDLTARNDRDVVVECTGAPEGLAIALALVRPRGTIVLKSTYAGGGPPDLAGAVINEISIVGSRCGPFPD